MNHVIIIGGAFLTFLPPTAGIEILNTAWCIYMWVCMSACMLGLVLPAVRKRLPYIFDKGLASFVALTVQTAVLFATEHYFIGAAFAVVNLAMLTSVMLDQDKKVK